MVAMNRWALLAIVLAGILLSSVLAEPALAADVNRTLVAENIAFRVGTTAKPTITVNPGDVLRLRIENIDSLDHTFTSDHFGVDVPMPGDSVVFVNITTSEVDRGLWQFHCKIPGHATGSGENRDGMVGWIQVGTPAPAPLGIDPLLIAGILVIVVVVIAVVLLMRRKK